MARFSSAPWFRALALCIALGFGGGYVWKRQKSAEHPSPPPGPAPVENGIFPVTPVEGESLDLEDVMMSSSKSGRIFSEPLEPDDEAGKSKQRVVLPSSKLGILPPPPEDAGQAEEASEDQKRKRLLPGSKSIDSILNEIDLRWSEEASKPVEEKKQEP
jgi:hypothetical protein